MKYICKCLDSLKRFVLNCSCALNLCECSFSSVSHPLQRARELYAVQVMGFETRREVSLEAMPPVLLQVCCLLMKGTLSYNALLISR